MTTDRDELFQDRVGLGLRELDGHETAPDVRNTVLAQLNGDADSDHGENRRPRLSRRALVAALLAGAVTTALMIEGTASEREPEPDPTRPGAAPQPSQQDPANQQDPKPSENPDDGSEYVVIRTLADVAAARPETTKIQGINLGAAELEAIATRLPAIKMLWLEGVEVSNEFLRAIVGIESVIGLRITGRFVATPGAYRSLTELPRLRHVALEDDVDTRDRKQWLDDACLREIRADRFFALAITAAIDGSFLRSLTKARDLKHLLLAHCRGIEPTSLRHVPTSVRDLDLRWTGLRGLEGHCKHLRGGAVRCSNGLRLEFPEDPDAKATCGTSTLRLAKRQGNRAYGNSAFSFRYDSGDVAIHNNHVDVVFNNCGNLHINAVGGMKSRAIDLGRTKLPTRIRRQGLPTAPQEMWMQSSIRPVTGNSYLEVVQRGDRSFAVLFTVTKLTADMIELEWRPLDEEQEWEPEWNAKAGTMGSCGGQHGPR